MSEAVAVPVSLFFDYACPFCYLASERLQRLRERHALAISWRFIEIHPETPAAGQPLSATAPPAAAQLQRMQEALTRMAAQDGIPLVQANFTCNSRRALLLAQAVLDQRPERFAALHRAIFRAHFVDSRNIGDAAVLEALAEEHAVTDLLVSAWQQPTYMKTMLAHVEEAGRRGLTGVPALVVADRVFMGADAVATLEQALQQKSGGAA